MIKKEDAQVELLDCTLRDGSYANNFQFSVWDTQNICSGLDKAGVRMIEVGHGLGLGITSPKLGIAFESDVDYLEAANKAVSSSKIGAFFIPGIGEDRILKEIAKNGLLDFIRIGVNVDEIDKVRCLSEELLSKGIEVHINLMKTYAMPLDFILEKLDSFIDLNLASIYVVDSAGCMLPNEVRKYVTGLVSSGWDVGFHGHNNLQLANANCLSALGAGAKYVDGSLSGMGRSAGNAQTEVLSWLISKFTCTSNIDTYALFDIANKFIKPTMKSHHGNEVIDLVIGMSRFHSGYLPFFKRVSGKYNVSIYRLIQKVSEIDCISPSEDLIIDIAKDLSRTDDRYA